MTLRGSLPNAITLLRLAFAPAAVWLILQDDLAAAFWVFAAAGVSDALDGALARLLSAQSALGSYLDALADKVLLVGVFVSLGMAGLVWTWLVWLVVLRDALLTAVAVALFLGGVQNRVIPLLVSKANTAAQIGLAGVVLGHQGLGVFPSSWGIWLGWLVAGTTVISGAAYLMSWPRGGPGGQGEL